MSEELVSWRDESTKQKAERIRLRRATPGQEKEK
jgi:hypothetical protein